MNETKPSEGSAQKQTQYLFVDEAGDPVLFHSSGKRIVDTTGCTRFFLVGKLEVDDPEEVSEKLVRLRLELLSDPYFAGVPSFKPERRKTALLLHAKDDLPEVRYRVFELIRSLGRGVRFHAVVCDKLALAHRETERRKAEPSYLYNADRIYDGLVRSLFSKFHRLADAYEVCIAKRGAKDRNVAIQTAIEHAERDFQQKFGFSRGGKEVWNIRISNPQETVCLQAVDYFLWAVQRFYEVRRNPETGEETREDRFLNLLLPQIAEIHDLDFGPERGTFWTAKNPLTLASRFGRQAPKTKKS